LVYLCRELLGQCRDLLEPNDERRILSNEHGIPLDQRCDQRIFIDGGSAASHPQVDSYSESLRNQKNDPADAARPKAVGRRDREGLRNSGKNADFEGRAITENGLSLWIVEMPTFSYRDLWTCAVTRELG